MKRFVVRDVIESLQNLPQDAAIKIRLIDEIDDSEISHWQEKNGVTGVFTNGNSDNPATVVTIVGITN